MNCLIKKKSYRIGKGAELNMHPTLYIFGDKRARKLFAPVQHETRENLKT